MQERQRNPYWGYWGIISGPILWGERAEEAGSKELLKQAGLTANLTVQSFYRKRDYDKATNALLEDKLFTILMAKDIKGNLMNDWKGGYNAWLTLSELRQKEYYFATTKRIIECAEKGTTFSEEEAYYTAPEY